MHKNKLENIIWEEISKTLNDLEPDELKAVVSSLRLAEIVATAKRSRKLYKVFKQRVQHYVYGGLMRRGEAQYFDDFVFPQLKPKGNDRVITMRDTARRGDRATAATARSSRHSAVNRNLPSGRTPGGKYQERWGTAEWGAEAVEQRIIQAGTKARTSTRAQFRQQSGLKNRDLKNADSVLDDAFDDGLTVLAKGGDDAADAAVHAFKMRIYDGLKNTAGTKKSMQKIVTDLGKKPGARDQLKKGLNAQVKRTEERIAKIQKQVDDLEAQMKKINDRKTKINKKKAKEGVSDADKARFDEELKALDKQNQEIAKSGKNRSQALEKSKARLEKEQGEVSKIDKMNDLEAGNAWIKQNLQKGLDDIDDAVRKGADDFRLNRTGKPPAQSPANTARRAKGRGGSRFEIDAARVIERTPKPVKDALGDAVEVASKDPTKLSKALQWVRSQSAARVEDIRNNPRKIFGIAIAGVTTGAFLVSLFGDSKDDNGNGHSAADAEQAREAVGTVKDNMDTELGELSKKINQAAPKDASSISFSFDAGCQDELTRIKGLLDQKLTVKDKVETYGGLGIDVWSVSGEIYLPEEVMKSLGDLGKAIISKQDFNKVMRDFILAATRT